MFGRGGTPHTRHAARRAYTGTPHIVPMIRPVTFTISEDYTGDLKKRLQEYGISQGALAREMGVQESQLSRWFNTPAQPRLQNIQRIETAVAAIRERREREAAKAERAQRREAEKARRRKS